MSIGKLLVFVPYSNWGPLMTQRGTADETLWANLPVHRYPGAPLPDGFFAGSRVKSGLADWPARPDFGDRPHPPNAISNAIDTFRIASARYYTSMPVFAIGGVSSRLAQGQPEQLRLFDGAGPMGMLPIEWSAITDTPWPTNASAIGVALEIRWVDIETSFHSVDKSTMLPGSRWTTDFTIEPSKAEELDWEQWVPYIIGGRSPHDGTTSMPVLSDPNNPPPDNEPYYTDHVFEMSLAYEEQEYLQSSVGKNADIEPLLVSINPVYNYRHEEYEALHRLATAKLTAGGGRSDKDPALDQAAVPAGTDYLPCSILPNIYVMNMLDHDNEAGLILHGGQRSWSLRGRRPIVTLGRDLVYSRTEKLARQFLTVPNEETLTDFGRRLSPDAEAAARMMTKGMFMRAHEREHPHFQGEQQILQEQRTSRGGFFKQYSAYIKTLLGSESGRESIRNASNTYRTYIMSLDAAAEVEHPSQRKGSRGVVDVSLLEDAEERKNIFPMYVDINISMTRNKHGGFASMLMMNPGLTELLMYDVANNVDIDGTPGHSLDRRGGWWMDEELMFNSSAGQYSQIAGHGSIASNRGNAFSASPLTKTVGKYYTYFSVDAWLNSNLELDGDRQPGRWGRNPGHWIPAEAAWGNHHQRPVVVRQLPWPTTRGIVRGAGAIGLRALRAELEKFEHEWVRSYEEILQGGKAYSETLFYEVVKIPHITNTGVASTTPQPEEFQRFMFPNHPDVDVVSFVDTQVKYAQKYEYKIYAWQFVLGTEYVFEDVEVIAPPDDLGAPSSATARVVAKSSPQIIRVPYVVNEEGEAKSINVRVADRPPMPPDIEFVPYIGEKEKVLIKLNHNTGEAYMDPIVVQEDNHIYPDAARTLVSPDEIFIEAMRDAAGNVGVNTPPDAPPQQGPILYRTDDYRGVFEVYRTERRPSGYRDFSGKLHAIQDGEIEYAPGISEEKTKASAVGFVDSIEPNKKYYYMARVKTKDKLSHLAQISNPTAVFQIELVSDETGIFYLNTQIIDFDAPAPPQKYTKQARQIIQVMPAPAHTTYDAEGSSIPRTAVGLPDYERMQDGAVRLGMANEGLWGKKFKIRVTSKDTGRKIDHNIEFKTKHIHAVSRNDE
tara:strand:+ start:6942 stop:10283 length:3342 start_codon:yes stop_codon:yes gene_type:complete